MTSVDLRIIACGLLGLGLSYWAKKRRFERTTIYGTEQFSSYKNKVKARLMDTLLWGLGIGGLVSATLLIFVEYAPGWGFLMLLLVTAFTFERDLYATLRRRHDRTH